MRNTHVRFTAVDGAEIVAPITSLILGHAPITGRCEVGVAGSSNVWTVPVATFEELSKIVAPLVCRVAGRSTTA